MAPNTPRLSLSLILVAIFLSAGFVASHPHAAIHAHVIRGESDLTTAASAIIATVSQCPTSGCVAATSTSFQTSTCSTLKAELFENDAKNYSIICEIDFPEQNIWPFLHVTSFSECKSKCDEYNGLHNDSSCAGFVYAPDRVNDTDDCYLKSSLNDPVTAPIHLVGATIISTAISTLSSTPTIASALVTPEASSSVQSHDSTTENVKPFPSSTNVVVPVVGTVKELGTSVNKPTNKYVSHLPALPMKLTASMLGPEINIDLITKYPIAGDTGIYNSDMAPLKPVIASMKSIPALARDGGKGGMVNGTHIVLFCDTVVMSGGQLVSLVSSSVATDDSMNGLYGNALELVDNLGEWQDDVGRMRGLSPMTEGEEAFNTAMSGAGYRYAIWPESSPIPINVTHALIYASIVYDQVDMTTQQYDLSPLGNTVLLIAIDPVYGPYASRPIAQLFQQGEITYGSLGGFRAWGKDGPGNQDGEIYLFGQVPNGVFMAKTLPSAYLERASYSYWDGHTWAVPIPDPSNQDALILHEAVKGFDLIYAPYYTSFIMVYMTDSADNTFYYRHCQPSNIIPPYQPNGQRDWAEAIHGCNWTARTVLYIVPPPQREFVYAGGVHAGYYGTDDITNGGQKMLISWTEKTGQNASSADAGYAHKTAYVSWNSSEVTPCPDAANGC